MTDFVEVTLSTIACEEKNCVTIRFNLMHKEHILIMVQ